MLCKSSWGSSRKLGSASRMSGSWLSLVSGMLSGRRHAIVTADHLMQTPESMNGTESQMLR